MDKKRLLKNFGKVDNRNNVEIELETPGVSIDKNVFSMSP